MLRLAGRGLAAAVLVVAGVALLLGVLVPRVAGATPYTVATGSMEPTLGPGTLAVVRPVDTAAVATGDVLTYQLRSGEPTVVTHRVVGLGTTAGGERTFVTRGDANEVADVTPVRAVQVRGTLWYAVPWLGHVSSLASGQQRQALGGIVAVGLFGYAGWLLAGEIRARRARAGT
ncbi:signal peptidase I [Isoptericola halotolerans]|uniref:Signal peptidase I n=1 Tax=Isoptericola halotolerans TaxID=300560 RepID=A0ABX2A7Q0_9MICO|nr:signal peptidase [Isoptericola halotolerans]